MYFAFMTSKNPHTTYLKALYPLVFFLPNFHFFHSLILEVFFLPSVRFIMVSEDLVCVLREFYLCCLLSVEIAWHCMILVSPQVDRLQLTFTIGELESWVTCTSVFIRKLSQQRQYLMIHSTLKTILFSVHSLVLYICASQKSLEDACSSFHRKRSMFTI